VVGVGTTVGVGTLVGVGTMVGSRVGIGVGSGVFKELRSDGEEVSESFTSSFTVRAKGLKSVASADAVNALRSTLVSSTSHPALP